MPKFEIAKLKVDLPKVDVPKPVYAGAGVAGLAVETVKEYVDTVSQKVTDYRSDVAAKVTGYQKQLAGFDPKAFAGTVQSRATARLGTLTAEAKARRAAVEERVGGLQVDAVALPGKVASFSKETASEALETYADLAKRGEVLVARLRREAPTEVTVSVKGTRPTPAHPGSGTTASKGTTPSSAARATAKKAPAKKTTAQKATAQKATAQTATAKKAPAKKAATTKSAAKKTTAKTTTASKAAPKTATTKAADTTTASGPDNA